MNDQQLTDLVRRAYQSDHAAAPDQFEQIYQRAREARAGHDERLSRLHQRMEPTSRRARTLLEQVGTLVLQRAKLPVDRLLAYLQRDKTLHNRAWHKRHPFLQAMLLLYLPLLFLFGVFMGRSVQDTIVVVSVLAACLVLGWLLQHRRVVIFWETTEREQRKTLDLTTRLAEAEITRRRFTSDLLVNLARRNQSLLYRQLGLINQLEDQAEDPDALADLFQLDHLATRIRRNAESLLVLSGEEPPRTWGRPVALVDVVRAAIAETEDLDRVVFAVDERLAVFGNAVADLTHLLAELVENAVHFSPPEASVILRTRPYLQAPGAHVLTVEDWGVGMRPEDMAAANEVLAAPQEVDLSVSQRLGLHVVARLAQRHGIEVSLTPTPGSGVTAAVVLPVSLFADPDAADEAFADEADLPGEVVPPFAASTMADPAGNGPGRGNDADGLAGDKADWSGWWEPSPGDPEGAEPVAPIAARLPLLSRRVPQAHLAPELRRSGQGPSPARSAESLSDATEARAALSRYQASRQAARAVAEEGGGAPAGQADEARAEYPQGQAT
jgi:signal transduction histidine kinase